MITLRSLRDFSTPAQPSPRRLAAERLASIRLFCPGLGLGQLGLVLLPGPRRVDSQGRRVVVVRRETHKTATVTMARRATVGLIR